VGNLIARLVRKRRFRGRDARLRQGLVPEAELVLVETVPSAEVPEAAVLAARAGDWRPAAAFLAAEGDGDLRSLRAAALGELAAKGDGWLRQWRADEPRDAAAALVQTESLVIRAWEVRTGGWAHTVSHDQRQEFRRLLGEAALVAEEAVRLAPAEDPNPWVAQLNIALGLGWSHERFLALWREIVSRDRRHVRAHISALQYWCQKWHGSHALMHGFVASVLAEAEPGCLRATLMMRAFYEEYLVDNSSRSDYRTPALVAAAQAAAAELAVVDPGHHRILATRGWVAWGLTHAGLGSQALEVFRSMGREVSGPWEYSGRPLQAFELTRTLAVHHAIAAEARVGADW
jgi:hypothetical protein